MGSEQLQSTYLCFVGMLLGVPMLMMPPAVAAAGDAKLRALKVRPVLPPDSHSIVMHA